MRAHGGFGGGKLGSSHYCDCGGEERSILVRALAITLGWTALSPWKENGIPEGGEG